MNRPDIPISTPSPSVARRKLIRAGFAVPVIATVASGSALAATSATCFQRQLSGTGPGVYPAVSAAGSSTTDTYIRVQLGRLGDAVPTYYVDGANLAAVLRALEPRAVNRTGIESGQFKEFNIGSNSEVGGLLTAEPAATARTYTSNGGQFAVLRFASDGAVVGVGQAGTSQQSAVQASCWSSIVPVP